MVIKETERMKNGLKYLVVMEPNLPQSSHQPLPQQTALFKAAELALKTNASIEAFACTHLTDKEINQHNSRQEAKRTAMETLMHWNTNEIAQISKMGVSVSAHIEWNSEYTKAVCYRAKAIRSNIIVAAKTANGNDHDNNDEQTLLRYAPCPVLLTHSVNHSRSGIVLAALDTQTMDGAHHALNNAILAATFNLAEDTDSTVHLVCALDEKKAVATHLGFEYLENISSEQTKLAEQFNISLDQLHVQLGNPQIIIKERAETLNTDTLVIGTKARKGIAGIFIGNTAEKVLSKIICDVLVVN
jgi:universal stress protein E